MITSGERHIEIDGKQIKLSKVSNIESVGVKHVYDIEVKDHHNYYAGGILVHNCLYHDILDHYNKKYNDEFYKVKDTFITYKARRLLLYPAGPNKKTLRGRTRFLSCIHENALVSTDKGLIKIKNVQVGDRVNIGKQIANVVAHRQTGVKEVWKLKLKSGQELLATPEHKICVYENGKFKKKKLSELRVATDHIVYTTGGEFPDTLNLANYVPANEFKDERHKLFVAMLELKSFDYTSL